MKKFRSSSIDIRNLIDVISSFNYYRWFVKTIIVLPRFIVLFVIFFASGNETRALTLDEITKIHTIVSCKLRLTETDYAFLEDKASGIPGIKDFIKSKRNGRMVVRCLDMINEALLQDLDKKGASNLPIYRHIAADLVEGLENQVRNAEALNWCNRIKDVTALYESDSVAAACWMIYASLLDPYSCYDLNDGLFLEVEKCKELHNLVKDHELTDHELEYRILSYIFSSCVFMYIEDFEQLYRRYSKAAGYISENDSILLYSCDQDYLQARLCYGKETGNGQIETDYEALSLLESLSEKVAGTIGEYKLNWILGSFYQSFDRLLSARKCFQTNVDQLKLERDSFPEHYLLRCDLERCVMAMIVSEINNTHHKSVDIFNDYIESLKISGQSHQTILAAYARVLQYFGSCDFIDPIWEDYINYVSSCPSSPETVYSLFNIAIKSNSLGRKSDCEKYLQRAEDLLDLVDNSHWHRFKLYIIRANQLLGVGQPEKALEFLCLAETESEFLSDVDLRLMLYRSFVEVYHAMRTERQESVTDEMILKYVEKYNALKSSSKWGQYATDNAKMRFYEICLKYPSDKHERYFKESLEICEKNYDYENAAIYCDALGYIYAERDQIKEAADYYVKAIQYCDEAGAYGSIGSRIGKLLMFYSLTNNQSERRRALHEYITAVDAGKYPCDNYYQKILVDQIGIEARNGVFSEARYLYEKVVDAIDRIVKCSNGDRITALVAQCQRIRLVIDTFSNFSDNAMLDSREQGMRTGMITEARDAIASILPEMKNIGGITLYRDLLWLRLRANISLKADYECVKSDFAALDSINVTSQNSYDQGLSLGLKISAAVAYNDIDRFYELVDSIGTIGLFEKHEAYLDVFNLSQLMFIKIFRDWTKKNYAEAEMMVTKRFGMVRNFIGDSYGTLSEDERIGMITNGVFTPVDINAVLAANYTPTLARTAYDASLFYKNLLLESDNLIRSIVMNSNDAIAINFYQQLCETRSRLSTINITDSISRAEFLRLRTLNNDLEAQIATRLPDISRMNIKRQADWRKVRNSLKDGEAAIEFIMTPGTYGALILRRGYDAPRFVPLISFEDIKSYMGSGKMRENDVRHLYLPGGGLKKHQGHLLYEKLWKPLEPELVGVERIFYTPVGDLCAIQFAAIGETMEAPLCTRYDLRLLSTTAQLADRSKGKAKAPAGKTVDIVGAVTYDADPGLNRGWQKLANSHVEVELVDSICGMSTGFDVRDNRTGLEASETWLNGKSGNSSDIMLFSTHGFYMSSDDARREDFFVNKGLVSDDDANKYISPLLRSGLILADANPVWTNSEQRADNIDGVVTAAEIANMDFSSTEMVVLSACQTGMGEPSATEGVNGLQRSFKLSGVNTVVMSLWEVNDRAGMMFMKDFFTGIASGKERHDAFRDAQLSLFREYPTNPFLWGAFVMLD